MVIEYGNPQSFADPRRKKAGRIGVIAIMTATAQVTAAFASVGLSFLIRGQHREMYSLLAEIDYFSSCALSITGSILGFWAIRLNRKSAKAWIGLLLNLMIVAALIGLSCVVYYLTTHGE